MIKLDNLSLAYGLTDLNCQISAGKLVGIMGANGSGKSTLLKAIAGILAPTSGEIWLNNGKLSTMSPQQKSQQLAYLAQSTVIHWDLNVYDVIALGLPHALPAEKERAKIAEISECFSIQPLLNKPFQQLSGGEKTRVQLARCCIKDTPILLADEPIAPLDPYYQIDIMQQLKALTPARTCLIAIHHLSLAYRFCDDVLLLDKGKILAYGATEEVLTEENLAKAFSIRVEIDRGRKEVLIREKLENEERRK